MAASAQQQSEGARPDLADYPDVIDMTVFEQILEMDDDEETRDFSKEIVHSFFEQAEQAIKDMRNLLTSGDNRNTLKQLSNLGHFLKGSSSTLGLIKVQRSCEKIQNFGKGLDATGNEQVDDTAKSMRDIRNAVSNVDAEYHEAKGLLIPFFGLE